MHIFMYYRILQNILEHNPKRDVFSENYQINKFYKQNLKNLFLKKINCVLSSLVVMFGLSMNL